MSGELENQIIGLVAEAAHIERADINHVAIVIIDRHGGCATYGCRHINSVLSVALTNEMLDAVEQGTTNPGMN